MTTGETENRFQMSNCAFFLMPGIDRMVLISSTGICLKVAFDLNFNLQTETGKKRGTYSFFSFSAA